jgi:sulfocyanin SoxE-like protein
MRPGRQTFPTRPSRADRRDSKVASAVVSASRSVVVLGTAAVAAAMSVQAGGSAASAHEAHMSGKPDPHRFFSWDAQTRVARLTLLAELGGANNGFNFDGYGRGELLVTVPLGWRVVVDCENRGGARHSCAVVRGSLSITPAFPGSASPAPITGLAPGRKATFAFRATRVGSYRIACLVPGHEQARQWDVLDVHRGGTPSISARPGP